MKLNFTKMQSLGNDFVMLNGVAENIKITSEIATAIADRHFGIGCDQILLAQKSTDNDGIVVRIFNSDGSEVGQCGNGARCFARYIRDQGLIDSNPVWVDTITTQLKLTTNNDNSVTVGMGVPIFDPGRIPFKVNKQSLSYTIAVDGAPMNFSVLSMGNPHAVVEVPAVEQVDMHRLGPLIENHDMFPQRVNAGFFQIVSRDEIKLRVYERGAGETLGCGSGACAAVVSGIRRSLLNRKVVVALPGGEITVEWPDDHSQVYLTGPVFKVFEGTIEV